MNKTIICDCFNLGEEKIYNGEKIIKEIKEYDSMVELENGIWSESMGDGRFFNSENENEKWATVQTLEFDENGEMIQSLEFLGYTEV